jgi:hypothetical protein
VSRAISVIGPETPLDPQSRNSGAVHGVTVTESVGVGVTVIESVGVGVTMSVGVGVTVSVGVGVIVSVGVGVGVTESVGVGTTEGDGVGDGGTVGGAVDGPGLDGGRGVPAGVIATNGCGVGWVVGARAKIGVPLRIAEPGGRVARGEAVGTAAGAVGDGVPRMG